MVLRKPLKNSSEVVAFSLFSPNFCKLEESPKSFEKNYEILLFTEFPFNSFKGLKTSSPSIEPRPITRLVSKSFVLLERYPSEKVLGRN